MAVAIGAVVLVLVGTVVAYVSISENELPAAKKPLGAPLDTDRDGISDLDETRGWLTVDGVTYVTDPESPDTDGDGLTDGDEAGPRAMVGESKFVGLFDPTKADSDDDGLSDAVETGDTSAVVIEVPLRAVTYAVSNPMVPDSDGDGIGDGDEYFLDMDPLLADTDSDGLLDNVELDFGSDPSLANPDGDSYTDAEEYELATNPLSYDLTGDERLAASAAGAKYGDCDECAIDAGLKVEQIESVEYLVGHVASGLALYGDARDLALNLWKGKFLAAGASGLGLLPLVGDASKTVLMLTNFAKRGDRAETAVRAATDKLPLSASVKQKILGLLPSTAGKLPVELAGGPKIYSVYKGTDYVGITKSFSTREAQHLRAGRTFTPTPIQGASNLSYGEARAIEQACIELGGLATRGGALQNRINSISPTLSYQPQAVAFGQALLQKVGGSCPV
ncbi:MAG: hypothetical protein CMJ44_10605 [Pimelobacter sp.]|nr:hypothetical protein [Pimelobacter sp.]